MKEGCWYLYGAFGTYCYGALFYASIPLAWLIWDWTIDWGRTPGLMIVVVLAFCKIKDDPKFLTGKFGWRIKELPKFYLYGWIINELPRFYYC